MITRKYFKKIHKKGYMYDNLYEAAHTCIMMTLVLIIVLHYTFTCVFLLYEQLCYIIYVYMWTTLSESSC